MKKVYKLSTGGELPAHFANAVYNEDTSQTAAYKKLISYNKKITYAQFCCNIRLQKDETSRTRLTVGVNLPEYDGKTSTETTSLETFKFYLNITISTKDANYVAAC